MTIEFVLALFAMVLAVVTAAVPPFSWRNVTFAAAIILLALEHVNVIK